MQEQPPVTSPQQKVVQYENEDRNLMKYLKPVKHLYRVAYADPTEHTKRAQNLELPI